MAVGPVPVGQGEVLDTEEATRRLLIEALHPQKEEVVITKESGTPMPGIPSYVLIFETLGLIVVETRDPILVMHEGDHFHFIHLHEVTNSSQLVEARKVERKKLIYR